MSLDDLFNSATGLGKLGIVGILALDLIVLAAVWFFELAVPGRAYRRELTRADRNLSGWEAATTQFEAALGLIERMQDRHRVSDEVH